MRTKSAFLLPLAAFAAAMLANPENADACGGCFHGVQATSTPSVVTGHRMAVSLSTTQTVLWDQVQYAGDPEDFAWVLPVGAGARIESSTDAWFETLEAVSGTQIVSPVFNCNGNQVQQSEGGGAFSCAGGGASSAAGIAESADAPNYDRDVTVLHEGTVGPYETVTLHATDGMSLNEWLVGHGYQIPPDIAPVIDAYVRERSDFIALRLQPGSGIRQMTPVRVITPGASVMLPLRMVAAGTGAQVSIVLYVISEGRYTTQNFHEVSIDFSRLNWDWSQSISNYTQLRTAALGSGDGKNILTTWVAENGLTAGGTRPDGSAARYSVDGSLNLGGGQATLADLYFAQSARNDGRSNTCGLAVAGLRSNNLAVDNCGATNPAGSATGDAGLSCAPLAADEVSASDFACGNWTDIATAAVGSHPASLWFTRLEAEFPRAALAEDLTLAASGAQTSMTNWHVSATSTNTPPCNASTPPPRKSSACSVRYFDRPNGIAIVGTFVALGAWNIALRLRRRRAQAHAIAVGG